LFASYSRADRAAIGSLLEDLRDLGHTVWMDEQLAGGQVWWEEILHNIRRCDAFLFLLSPSSVDSEACMAELHYANALDRTVVPVEITPVDRATLPSLLGEHHIVRYSAERASTLALARALSRLDTGRPLPDPLPPPPPLPGSYFSVLRDQITSGEVMSFDQQLGVVHRLRARADDPATSPEIEELIDRFRDRDDLYAAVADELADLRASLPRPQPPPRARPTRRLETSRLWARHRATTVLVSIAVAVGLGAMAFPLYTAGDNSHRWGATTYDPSRWHLALLLLAFIALYVVSAAATARRLRLGSAGALLLVAVGGVAWWWVKLDDLLRQTYLATGAVQLDRAVYLVGISLWLQTAVGFVLLVPAVDRLLAQRAA
jgi:hypothetical protein